MVCFGKARFGSQGEACRGRQGLVGQVRVRQGSARRGLARQGRAGLARHSRRGKARQSRLGVVRCGLAGEEPNIRKEI